jgi:hypothetical protein
MFFRRVAGSQNLRNKPFLSNAGMKSFQVVRKIPKRLSFSAYVGKSPIHLKASTQHYTFISVFLP